MHAFASLRYSTFAGSRGCQGQATATGVTPAYLAKPGGTAAQTGDSCHLYACTTCVRAGRYHLPAGALRRGTA